jgi:hypothetical protein
MILMIGGNEMTRFKMTPSPQIIPVIIAGLLNQVRPQKLAITAFITQMRIYTNEKLYLHGF